MDTRTSGKMVYRLAEGGADMVALFGSKGAHASEMARMGLPVPPGFVITTETSLAYYRGGRRFPDGLWEAVVEHVHALETETGRRFGGEKDPLIVSVRSGAAVSMPGMMDTILNMGVTDDTVGGLAEMMGGERPALDAHRRLVQGYGAVVLGIEKDRFEAVLTEAKRKHGLAFDYELEPEPLRKIIERFKGLIVDASGEPLPTDPWELLRRAIQAVFDSWNNPRAITYRDHEGISHDLGTGCVIMSMVFGNLGPDSGTGVLFTRSPATGEKMLYGEFLVNAQGEDVVAGVRTPQRIAALEAEMPRVYAELEATARKLEAHYGDVQDIEFTVERGVLFILQTRTAKRTAPAAVRIAVDLVHEGVLSESDALGRIAAEDVTQVLMPRFVPEAKAQAVEEGRLLAQGVGASPGAASGIVVMDPDRAVERAEAGERVVLVRHETSPDDVHGIIRSEAVLTSRGGMTSHAAVVTRGMGKPCVVGCEELHFDALTGTATARGKVISEGDVISIDGATGEVFVGEVATKAPDADEMAELNILLGWADNARRLGVWANADNPEDAALARRNGAEGIGLVRTEHMFFAEERLPHIRHLLEVGPYASRLIREAGVAETALEAAPASQREELTRRLEEAKKAVADSSSVEEFHAELARLERYQAEDFYGIMKAMEGLPVVIRLLDAPLHEFLPHWEELLVEELTLSIAAEAGEHGEDAADWLAESIRKGIGGLDEPKRVLAVIDRLAERDWQGIAQLQEDALRTRELVGLLREANPMMGNRGCRVGLTMPEIYEMQVRAIVTAACRLTQEGAVVYPEIMIPIVSHVNELKWLRPRLRAVASATREALGVHMTYKFGTMIEVPRAALTAGEIAENTEFFSFGSNDLTQMTFAFSRDDAEAKFVGHYVDAGVLPGNPFSSLDRKGVGRLMRIAVEEGRAANPGLPIGICGEHGGDPRSIALCHELGLDYVSASPYRVPVARLAAAQSALGILTPGD
ncbi:MAG: pyruvate, phosphate dikinase [Chloroflexi bacterium]|nr:pyruvate, phosphate dikinase [Chloroflexota bacterium]